MGSNTMGSFDFADVCLSVKLWLLKLMLVFCLATAHTMEMVLKYGRVVAVRWV